MRIPRFSTPLHVVDNSGLYFVRDLDLTHLALTKEKTDIAEVKRWEEGAGPHLQDLLPYLSEEESAWARDGKLVLPRFHSDLVDFWCRVPTVEGRLSLLAQLDSIQHARLEVDRARDLAEAVRNARLADPADVEFLYLVGADAYVAEIEEAREREMSGIENPEHLTSKDVETLQHFPLAFGARQLVWEGISAEQVYEFREEGEDFTVSSIESLIDNSLVAHHEDAHSHLVDVDELYEILGEWAEQEAEGREKDFDLERKLAAWNGKQRLLSYYPDQGVVIPLAPGLSHSDLVAWCESRVERLESKLDELQEHTAPVNLIEPDHVREAPSLPSPGRALVL